VQIVIDRKRRDGRINRKTALAIVLVLALLASLFTSLLQRNAVAAGGVSITRNFPVSKDSYIHKDNPTYNWGASPSFIH